MSAFGFVYDERMLEHDCPYDPTMAEKPERMKLIYERLKHDGLLEDAFQIPGRLASDAELLRNHPEDFLRELESLTTSEQCENFCRSKEILWLAPESDTAARVAAGSSIDIVRQAVQGRINNGFAIVRPPGHHSYGRLPAGYCVFNNVAVAAKAAVEEMGVKKVAVVDFDYHPGNGTLYSLKEKDSFFFCSFHAYHYGAFWPFDDTFDYATKGNQVFFPLNGSMNTEGDFLGAFHHVLLPILREWQPEVILISAGFDAGYYDIMMEVGQAVKAHGYGHMARLLSEICPGKTIAILEGGYFAPNYTEASAMMVRGLKGLPIPNVSPPKRISGPLAETIWNNVIHHKDRYKCMKELLEKLTEQQRTLGLPPFIQQPQLNLSIEVRKLWDQVLQAGAVRTREWFPELTEDQVRSNTEKINQYIKEYDWSSVKSCSEEFHMKQLVWDDQARTENFLHSAPVCLFFVNDFRDFIQGKKSHMMICDRTLYEEAVNDGRIPKESNVFPS